MGLCPRKNTNGFKKVKKVIKNLCTSLSRFRHGCDFYDAIIRCIAYYVYKRFSVLGFRHEKLFQNVLKSTFSGVLLSKNKNNINSVRRGSRQKYDSCCRIFLLCRKLTL